MQVLAWDRHNNVIQVLAWDRHNNVIQVLAWDRHKNVIQVLAWDRHKNVAGLRNALLYLDFVFFILDTLNTIFYI
jgi:hypothetical protein